MKRKALLSTLLMTTIAALSLGAQAAEVEKAPAEQAEKSAPKKVKPHSHVTEKTGVPVPAAAADKAETARDVKRHNHQRDAK